MRKIVLPTTDVYTIANFISGSGIGVKSNKYKIEVKEKVTIIYFEDVIEYWDRK